MTQPATSEDITLQTRWLLEQMERDITERREWWYADQARYKEDTEKHRSATNRVGRYMLYRGVIETLILIVLIWRSF